MPTQFTPERIHPTPLEVQLRNTPLTERGCRLFTGRIRPNGYGVIQWNKIQEFAHRAAWIVASGMIPEPYETVNHVCDVRHCIRNDGFGIYTVDGIAYPRFGHLWLGTRKANNLDRAAKGRSVPIATEKRLRGNAHWVNHKPERIARGSRHGHAKLSEVDVQEIRRLWATRLATHESLALRFGIHVQTVYKITSRKRWRHLP